MHRSQTVTETGRYARWIDKLRETVLGHPAESLRHWLVENYAFEWRQRNVAVNRIGYTSSALWEGTSMSRHPYILCTGGISRPPPLADRRTTSLEVRVLAEGDYLATSARRSKTTHLVHTRFSFPGGASVVVP